MQRQAVLVVSFGTSYKETREKTIEAAERQIGEAFPGREVRRAFTSPTIIRKMRRQEGILVENVEQALERMLADGVRDVIVQPTLVIGGFEYHRLRETAVRYAPRFDRLVCGEPLLSREEDYRRCARILTEVYGMYRKEGTDLVLMGHGTEHEANESYERLQQALTDLGAEDTLIGTVEASPTLKNMVRLVERRGSEAVVLAPLLLVAGEHACQDMAGNEEDSWKCRFEREGRRVTCVLRGLGEYEEIRRMYADHARLADEEDRRMEMEVGSGILYGIGVGPGDPELMTLKAVRIIRSCDLIVAPGREGRKSVAYSIALGAVPELAQKPCFGVEIPMVHDRERLKAAYDQAADQVEAWLKEGKRVGFLNLGDVTLYATYLHIHRRIRKRGYQTELVNGVPSFCAAAAAFQTGLAEGHEQLHILAKPDQVEDGLSLPGTKVIMKSGSRMEETGRLLRACRQQVLLAENCGMENQRLVFGAEAITGQEGYYSLILVKEKREAENGADQ